MMRKLHRFLLFALIVSACSSNRQNEDLPAPAAFTSTPTIILRQPLFTLGPAATSDTPPLVSAALSTHAPTITPTPASDFWMDLPVVPTGISERVRQIYQHGLQMGNDPHAF